MKKFNSLKSVFAMTLTQNLGALVLVVTLGAGIGTAIAAGPVMHVNDARGNLGTVDVTTGAVTLIGTTGQFMTDIAFDPSGNLFGLTFTDLYSINPTTAASTLIGPHSIPGGNALVFGNDGTLYGAGSSTSLFTINTLTGAGTSLGTMGFASGGDLAFNSGNFFLASSGNQLININLGNLSSTFAVGGFGVSGVFGLATGSDNLLYAVAGTTVYTVNTATGAATNPVSFSDTSLSGLTTAFGQSFFTEAVGVVPEPEIYAMMGIGLALMGFVARRRKLQEAVA